MPADQLTPEMYKGKGHGYTLFESKADNRAVLVFGLGCRTDEQGAFELTSNVTGELVLFVSPGRDDLRSTRTDVGAFDGDVEGVEVVVERGDGSLVHLRKGKASVIDTDLDVVDVTFVEQAGVRVHVDKSGCFPASVLERGHKYAIRRDGVMGLLHFLWNGEPEIDLDKLPVRPPWPMGR
jgi:hypothetical protein